MTKTMTGMTTVITGAVITIAATMLVDHHLSLLHCRFHDLLPG